MRGPRVVGKTAKAICQSSEDYRNKVSPIINGTRAKRCTVANCPNSSEESRMRVCTRQHRGSASAGGSQGANGFSKPRSMRPRRSAAASLIFRPSSLIESLDKGCIARRIRIGGNYSVFGKVPPVPGEFFRARTKAARNTKRAKSRCTTSDKGLLACAPAGTFPRFSAGIPHTPGRCAT